MLLDALGSIGVISQMEQFSASIGDLSSMQQGVYVACILLSSSISSLASGDISDRISRKYGIFIGGILFLIGTVVSAVSPNFASLIIARLITGLGMGQTISMATVYLVEIATADIRGVTACLLQLFVVTGVMTGYFIAYGTHSLSGSLAWRTPFIVQAAMAAIFCAGVLFIPFSPRWLVQAGRSDDAKRVLLQLRIPPAVDVELEEIQKSLQTGDQNAVSSWREIVHRKYISRTALGVFLMSFQQLTGVSGRYIEYRRNTSSSLLLLLL